jgi:hypothetical protein
MIHNCLMGFMCPPAWRPFLFDRTKKTSSDCICRESALIYRCCLLIREGRVHSAYNNISAAPNIPNRPTTYSLRNCTEHTAAPHHTVLSVQSPHCPLLCCASSAPHHSTCCLLLLPMFLKLMSRGCYPRSPEAVYSHHFPALTQGCPLADEVADEVVGVSGHLGLCRSPFT